MASRGDLVTVAVSGDFGNPRPALVIQSDQFSETETVTVLLLSSTVLEAPLIRFTLQPTAENGLQRPSQVMVDKAMTVRREKLGPVFGRIDAKSLTMINRLLVLFFGLA